MRHVESPAKFSLVQRVRDGDVSISATGTESFVQALKVPSSLSIGSQESLAAPPTQGCFKHYSQLDNRWIHVPAHMNDGVDWFFSAR